MKSKRVLVCFFIMITILFDPFKIHSEADETDKTAQSSVEDILKSKQNISKENPFVIRQFEPYMDGQWIGNAVSYGCYRKGQAPGRQGPSKAEVLEDLHIIQKHWNLIRVYNADDDTERILEVIRENNLPIKVMLGVWLAHEEADSTTKAANIANTKRAIELAGKYPSLLAAINVGNETQVFWSWHKMKQENLIRYIRAIRNNTTVPVTTADDYNFWNKPESRPVADEIDFIVTHIYPLWNGKTLDNAITWLDSTFQDVHQRHPDKQLVLGEIGWATNYNPDKKGPGEQGTLVKGKVGLEAQEKFLTILHNWTNDNQVTTFLFEAFDEPWKGGGDDSGPNEIEKHWGVFYENRTPKESFTNFRLNNQ